MNIFTDKRTAGILWAILLAALFVALSLLGFSFLQGISRYIFSSLLRLLFGLLILRLFTRLYGTPAKELLRFRSPAAAWAAGAGFLLFFAYYLVLFFSGFSGLDIGAGILLSRVFLQQITTGFYEELQYRALVLEGYFHREKQTVPARLAYAALSFFLFGAVHVVTGWDLHTFLYTGVIGFSFAVIYLRSRNLLLPMLLHFIFDIFANLAPYAQWNESPLFETLNGLYDPMLVILFLVSLLLLVIKKLPGRRA